MRCTLALIAIAGCAADVELSTTSSNIESQNKIVLNKIVLNKIVLNKIVLNGLTSLTADVATMLDDEGSRDVFKYFIQCALPEGASVTASDSAGTSYTFAGAIGLAPSWATAAPTDAERRWVSACLLARTNLFGVSVAISLRGAHAALTEDEGFTLREGAFWGDVFGETMIANACPGRLELEGSQLSTLPLRECTVSEDGITTKCGHSYAGPCADACTDTGGTYQGCAGAAEVITTYVLGE